MRSKIFFIIAATLLCVSCEKTFVMETELEIGSRSETFTATIECEPSTRTSLSDFNSNESFYSLIWSKGDAISISDGAKTAIYTTDDNYSSTAEFIRSEGSISNKASQYTAFYPSTITTSNMVLPATQNYVEDNVHLWIGRVMPLDTAGLDSAMVERMVATADSAQKKAVVKEIGTKFCHYTAADQEGDAVDITIIKGFWFIKTKIIVKLVGYAGYCKQFLKIIEDKIKKQLEMQ